MRKINSNGYAGKVMLIGSGILIIGVLLRYLLLVSTVISIIVIAIGAVILAGFALLLMIEFRQDRKINREYDAIRTTKIRLPDGLYECQACGNMSVHEDDDSCRICENRFT